jgi:hypothetical protein
MTFCCILPIPYENALILSKIGLFLGQNWLWLPKVYQNVRFWHFAIKQTPPKIQFRWGLFYNILLYLAHNPVKNASIPLKLPYFLSKNWLWLPKVY